MTRPLRRIFGEVRFGKVDHNDAQLRAKTCSELASGLQELLALPHARAKGEPMPWTKLILSDMAVLQDRIFARSQFFLPPPAEAPEAWGEIHQSLLEPARAAAILFGIGC